MIAYGPGNTTGESGAKAGSGAHSDLEAGAVRPIGAAWLRCLSEHAPGYGFVAPDVPELSIAVAAGHRRQGVGRQLLADVIEAAVDAGHTRISLSVERANPAQRLYRSAGFRTVASGADSDTMVRSLVPGAAPGPYDAVPWSADKGEA